ncbi:hypothetical protein H4R24_004385 [Coemansia sp. RSA 988]|nr:hypothetical protein H4R24_004385 [Coemansia sp. RSA 988]
MLARLYLVGQARDRGFGALSSYCRHAYHPPLQRIRLYSHCSKLLSERAPFGPIHAIKCRKTYHTTHTINDSGHSSFSLEKALFYNRDPYLTKFFRLLPEKDQASLQSFSDSLRRSKRLIRRIAIDAGSLSNSNGEQPSRLIIDLIDDYGSLGFVTSSSEYSSLIRALALEPGRESEALQLLDSIVESSEIAPFLKSLRNRQGKTTPVADRIPSYEEIDRIEKALEKAELASTDNLDKDIEPQVSKEDEDQTTDSYAGDTLQLDPDTAHDPVKVDRIQALVIQQRQARTQKHKETGLGKMQVSRAFYHMAMRGFAEIYHVRGVLEILNRMLESATMVPFRIARHLMPNKETWDIVSEVLVRQRDRPTFVKAWIEFLSRGAQPPVDLTRKLVRLLVQQLYVEQAMWVMRISRCLPDFGEDLPKSPYSIDRVPWELKVQITHVASALDAAASLDTTYISQKATLKKGRLVIKLPYLNKPDPGIYAYLIGGAVRANNANLAEHLFRELVDAGVAPTGSIYARLANLYSDRGNMTRVFLIVRKFLIQQYKDASYERNRRGMLMSADESIRYKMALNRRTALLQNDVKCIAPLLRFYLQEGREHEALTLLRSWDIVYKDHVPIGKLALALLEVYNRPGDMAEAEGLLRRLIDRFGTKEQAENGVSSGSKDDQTAESSSIDSADPSTTLRAYTQMIRGYFKTKNLPGIVNVLRELSAKGLRPQHSMWEAIMSGFLREQALDLFDTVHAFVHDILKVPLSLPLYSLWMQTLRNHGDVLGVQAAFNEMTNMGQIPTQQHYLILVQAYAYGGWVEQAVSIVENLRKPHKAANVGLELEIAVIEAFVVCGDMERAEVELDRLLSNTHLPVNRIPARPFNYMIIGHLYKRDGVQAMDAYRTMLRAKIKPDVYTFAILMYSYAVSGDIGNCMRVFNEMVRVGIGPDLVIYAILIHAFGASMRVAKAEHVFKQVLQEQEWARSQVSGEGLSQGDDRIWGATSESLNLYADSLRYSDTMDEPNGPGAKKFSLEEQLRMRSFIDLDPVLYVVMISVYRQSNLPLKAMAMWNRMVRDFPIVRWNPRKGGILTKTMHYTGGFHLPAWTLVLRTVRASIGVPMFIGKTSTVMSRFTIPIGVHDHKTPHHMRRKHNQLLRKIVSKYDHPIADQIGERLKRRTKLIHVIEKELDRRIITDRRFCMQQRLKSLLPDVGDIRPFSDYGYWIPNKQGFSELQAHLLEGGEDIRLRPDYSRHMRKTERVEKEPVDSTENEEAHQNPAATPKFFGHLESTVKGLYGRTALLARQWRALEDNHFQFNNLHVVEYMLCMLYGRHYKQLIRLLSMVEPKAAESSLDPAAGAASEFRYRNVHISWHFRDLLITQLRVIRWRMLAERDRRVMLAVMLNIDDGLYNQYASMSAYEEANPERNEDELQVMHERLVIHHEREFHWSEELRLVVEVGRALYVHMTGKSKEELVAAVERAFRAL